MVENIKKRELIFMMLFAYIFSIAVRMIWVAWAKDIPQFYWNNELMINTNDGYYFASGVLNELTDKLSQNPRVPSMYDYAVVFFSTLFVKYTPFSIDTVILYMPAFISSLVVIPLILIGRLFGMTAVGFFSALLGSIAWSYYNRTMIGYYDSDMFSAMAPMFILYFLMATIVKEDYKYLILSAISIIIYPFLYDQGLAIVYAIGLIFCAVIFYIHKDKRFTYQAISIISLSLLPINKFLLIGLIVLLFFIFKKEILKQKQEKILSVVLVVLFIFMGNIFGVIWTKVIGYTIKGAEEGRLHFFAVNQTVREAGKTLFFSPLSGAYQTNIADRVIGSNIAFILSIIGYILLLFKNRVFLLALPLIGIGLFAHWGGLRFTVYAVAIASFSAIYFIYFISSKLLQNKKYSILATMFISLAIIYPNYKHILNYKVPTVFTKNEVEVLDKLKAISNNKDYTIAWWDYGYPIWYYSNTNTLIDGGKHNHDNFIVSKILLSTSATQAANLSRVSVEEYAKKPKIVADKLFWDKNPNIFLKELKKEDFKLPKKSRDIYLYLPARMLDILPTIDLFSNLDLLTGEKKQNTLFYASDRIRENSRYIDLGNRVVFDKKELKVMFGNNKVSINTIIATYYDKNGSLKVQKESINPTSDIYLIFMKSYHKVILLDKRMFNSLYIKMFVLEEYDKKLFEPVVLTPYAKIYKLKR